ncbi:hypothetical protein HO173_000815 [Letharia columbiana]|uniref:Uncharacterized protein n=1 Tax=Letharia columbiana TaxID=112416 RepID=A0A8H6G604_9LECA|nr:uncharacterized protein HO173_000815 [Letharia columbiana]KAF6241021.1 hypothetical protein HO173_000815 [Letharia columbiana]
MTTQNRAALMLSSLKKTIIEVSGSYSNRGSGYYDAPPVEDKTPLVQDLEEMIVSPLTTKDEKVVLIDTLMVVRVLQRLKEEEWSDRLKEVFEKGDKEHSRRR